jgi:uncharacterized protein
MVAPARLFSAYSVRLSLAIHCYVMHTRIRQRNRDSMRCRQLESSMIDIDSPAQSPCVGNCCLDDDLTCLGCFRSLQEIKEWAIADDQRRCVILQNAEQRRAASK